MRVCQVISLFIIARSLEDFAYAKDYSILRMKESEETEHNINSFRERHDKEVLFFKDKSVKRIIEAHGSYFSEIVDYDDWDGAMKFLNNNPTRSQLSKGIRKEIGATHRAIRHTQIERILHK